MFFDIGRLRWPWWYCRRRQCDIAGGEEMPQTKEDETIHEVKI